MSHETVYRSLFIQARGALKKELLQHLRRIRVMRRSRHHTQKTADHGRIWEGDLLCGSNNSQITTLVERHTRYVMLAKVDSKESETEEDIENLEGDELRELVERV